MLYGMLLSSEMCTEEVKSRSNKDRAYQPLLNAPREHAAMLFLRSHRDHRRVQHVVICGFDEIGKRLTKVWKWRKTVQIDV